MRDDYRVDVPQLGELVNMFGVFPVAESGQRRAAAGLSVVLRGGLTVHLQDARTRSAEHAAQQVQIVDLTGAAVAWWDW